MKWISVEERTPTDDKLKLVVFTTDGEFLFSRTALLAFFLKGEWKWSNSDFEAGDLPIEGEVTHWMPLPEPPEK